MTQNETSLYGLCNNIEPAHYKRYGTSLIELLDSMSFLQGNIIKYVARYKHKNGVEDLNKAMWYLKRLIEIETTVDNYFESKEREVRNG